MRGSEFIAVNAGKSLAQWEAMAVSLASQDPAGGGIVPWPMVPVNVTSKDGKHTGRFFVASDYFAIGTADDYVRLPLTPITAQRIANTKGMLLPTSKMVEDIWRAGYKLSPQPMVPNKGANLLQYAEHSQLIDAQIPPSAGQATPISGHKKDVIVSNIWKPGRVVIFGWYRPDGTYIQPKSNIHGDYYVDYSHGIRLVGPNMEVDGQTMLVEDVLESPEYASLLSREGIIHRVRYPAGTGQEVISSARSPGGRLSYYKLGTSVLLALDALGRRRAA